MQSLALFYRSVSPARIAPCVLMTLAGCFGDFKKESIPAPTPIQPVVKSAQKTTTTPPHNPLNDLPPAVADAWNSAGATQVGWMSLSHWGSVGVIPESYATEDDLPVFVFEKGWTTNPPQALPDPGFDYGVAFAQSETLPDSLGPFLEYAPVDHCVALRLWGNVASFESVNKLDQLPNLHSLALSEVKDLDEMLKPIGELKSLTRLEVSSVNKSDLTDAGLAELEGLENLKWLCLTGAQVTDKGMTVLASLPQLEGLHLARTDIGIQGIEPLLDLKGLRYLNVHETGIRDEAGELVQMNQLKELVLQRSFDEQELKKIEEALPDCKIVLP